MFDRQIIHDIHNYVALFLALSSLYWQSEDRVPETYPIFWSLSYFTVDLLDTLSRADAAFTMHAVISLVLGMNNYWTPLAYQLRMNSKAQCCELSSPFLYLSKRTRKPMHFIYFAIAFTLCRMVWIPYMLMQLYQGGMPVTDFRFVLVVLFYLLNAFWYSKIIRILIRGGDSPSSSNKAKALSSSTTDAASGKKEE